MTKTNKIPEFSDHKEEAAFWDSHSFADYWEEMPDIKVNYDPLSVNKEVMTVRVDPALKKSIEDIAKGYSLTPSSLIRMWLVGKVKEDPHGKYGE